MSNQTFDGLLAITSMVHELAEREKQFAVKRTDVRYGLSTILKLGQRNEKDEFVLGHEAWGLDVSYQGLGFIVNEPIAIGTQFWVQMPGPKETQIELKVRVVHCVKTIPNLYRVGAMFMFDVKGYSRAMQADSRNASRAGRR